ncbi:dDENN domain-containing protein [Plectosphaerella plurivora]|uniref:DDENN domain-containing protein n=1 Tax=Plectosphaerella plurivora TaxID=936078 RepID=A0A9P8V528_9PEZI|nr:dDENN domain-containing protein [Plectosphaerella plurivora]
MDGSTSRPLADYFWIAGVESISYDDSPLVGPSNVEDPIAEDAEQDHLSHASSNGASTAQGPSRPSARHSRQNSANRLSSSRFSIHTLDESDGNTRSNRSSVTIRASQAPGSNANGTTNGGAPSNGLHGLLPSDSGNLLDGFDFDTALLKFAAEREDFLDDLSFSAGAKLQARPPMVNPRAERIKADENDLAGRRSPLRSIERSIKGSIRRKISFRDMNSSRKQPVAPRAGTPGAGRTTRTPLSSSIPSPIAERPTAHDLSSPGSIRTSKRLSNYNSVIPPPEPLNTDPNMHPLKRRFEPVLLDRYPTSEAPDDIARRGKFPDYVPMFAFPNDIQVVSSDERPRSTWHGFTMTSDDNSKLYGITIIIWTALTADVADQVEKRCEEWRQRHMSNEERELAASLGLRLAAERAYLSQLLAKLPSVPSGSTARDALDEQISAVEEKISLMTEMLRPLRHGAASKIDGLTAGESGLWTPRAYGILGRDSTRITFWKEWLRAVIVPMTDGAVLRVPFSSPRVGRWQPLERYVINMCTEAFSPLGSKTQVELSVRELRMYARKDAANEIPGSRTVDIYALFRCLSLDNIVALFEFAMSESRIIFLSSHTAMLHLACHALAHLLYPLKWASIFIPVLPARLLSALDAPCPYIVGIERRYENIELPDDDYVLVDLDKDTIDSTSQPIRLPRQHRRKLYSLLQIAAPHKIRYGVATGPPPYAIESFPYDAFSAENASLFNPEPTPSTLAKWVAQNSSSFGEPDPESMVKPPIFNAFLHSKLDPSKSDRPGTSKSARTSPPSSVSPISTSFPPMPTTPVSRSDSGFAMTNTLREKRSRHFDEKSRRSSSFGMDKPGGLSRPNLPFLNGHVASNSVSAVSVDSQSTYGGGYAPSTYAQSTLAASTIMPNMLIQPVRNTETTVWVEGHCFNWVPSDMSFTCSVCDDRSEGDGIYKCTGCGAHSHGRCLGCVSLVCSEAFHPDRVRAAFVRCLASLLYTYRKYLGRPSKEQKTNGRMYSFDMDGFVKSLPYDQQDYANMMRETQGFNEFIHERETNPGSTPSIRLFDEIILAKKARGRPGIASGLSRLSSIRLSHGASTAPAGYGAPQRVKIPTYLSDTSEHLWRTASVPTPSGKVLGDYRAIVTRVPAKLDTTLMKEPRVVQGVVQQEQRGTRGLIRKQVPSMLGTSPTG